MRRSTGFWSIYELSRVLGCVDRTGSLGRSRTVHEMARRCELHHHTRGARRVPAADDSSRERTFRDAVLGAAQSELGKAGKNLFTRESAARGGARRETRAR